MTTPSLPWRPIAEADKSKTYVVGSRNKDGEWNWWAASFFSGQWLTGMGFAVQPTHFLEITPPAQDGCAVTDAMADAGGKALRERQMAGRITREWSAVPRSERRKWVETARCVVEAALRAAETKEPGR